MAKIAPLVRKRARELRSSPTEVERKLWQLLRDKQLSGWRFRRQHPVAPYVLDFACLEAKLGVEADGAQHAESARDDDRDRFLAERGWRVLRFWNNEIASNPEGTVESILLALGPHPGPPPPAAGEGAPQP